MRPLLLAPFLFLVIFPNDLLAESCKSLLESQGLYSASKSNIISELTYAGYSETKRLSVKELSRCKQVDIERDWDDNHGTNVVSRIICNGKELYAYDPFSKGGCLFNDNKVGDIRCFSTTPPIIKRETERCKQINNNTYDQNFRYVDSAYSSSAKTWFHIVRFHTLRYNVPSKFKPPVF